MKEFIKLFFPLIDLLLLPLLYPSALLMKLIRTVGVHRLPNCKKALLKVGVFPIRNHYYEPQFDYQNLTQPLSNERLLPAIDWNVDEQIEILSKLSFSQELADTPQQKTNTL